MISTNNIRTVPINLLLYFIIKYKAGEAGAAKGIKPTKMIECFKAASVAREII